MRVGRYEVHRGWVVAAVAVLAFVGLSWWDETQLWNAAKNHYLGPLQIEQNARLQGIIDACETAMVEEGLPVPTNVLWDFPSLVRGDRRLTADGLLEWGRLYQFKLQVSLRQANGFVELVCDWDPERHAAEIILPDGA